ncbi:polyprenyl synthetase family protein [Microbacterium dextranolyticum]|uniref:Geranylgeranyl pyrophosphate synthase n=1 Tax=Microbacterium dextranolyticum TaxID=36806 RepID=A0A9W6HN61_9MICO|nr:polyprenyl synthetase family protein [Microbacterium dextranolyticum]MBM7462634.1 geranylgeranyl diphosphate synthase type I [Microbacterium dextranolyticum]GLJ96262.1 geranylgeranyl pyrophosphate synthase [Microbacterium dextranolyticum]
MTSPSDPIAAVSQRLASFVADETARWQGSGAETASFLTAAASAVDGGKRLRARFCLAGWEAVAHRTAPSAQPGADVIAAAAALEVFHAAALVHDDLIDNSDTRRGRPAAHRGLEAHHRGAGWAGDPVAFGRSGAILLGDLLVAWSDDLLEQGLTQAAHAAGAREVYALMRREVTVGQFLDIAEEAAFVTAPAADHAERALRVASLKSARYSVQHPLLLGARLAGADASQTAALSEFGHPLGLAFQLRDDVLGVFGDAAVTGKPSGDDLREGKRTVLIAYARERMTASAVVGFDALLGDTGLDDTQIADLQQTIIDTGALERVEQLIAGYTLEADAALQDAPLAATTIDTLRALARDATARTA